MFFAAAVVGSFCNLLTVIYIGNAGCREPVMISLDHLVSDNFSLKIHDVTDCVSFSNRSLLDALVSGFVCAHTLPVLYEKYQDQVDEFLCSMLGLLQHQYQKLGSKGVLGKGKARKSD